MKLKKGDTVLVTTGKDKGKKGKVETLFPKENRVTVHGVNVMKRHTKKKDEKTPGGIIEVTHPIAAAKVALMCPSCGKQTRVGYVTGKSDTVRICRKCKQKI